MRIAVRLAAVAVFAIGGLAAAQELEAPWDARKIIGDVLAQAKALEPLLAQTDPQTWVSQKGAPTTYINQWQSAREQLQGVGIVAKQFQAKAESLPLGLDTYFRLESLEQTERALNEGAQQYDTRQNADKLAQFAAQAFDSRQHLRSYLQNLAATTEENFRIADSEAQRCRQEMSRQSSNANAGSSRRSRTK